jgi:serine phosphatase RsbU (regulator of sigma subunit)
MTTAAAELTVFRAPGFACVRVVGRANFAAGPGFRRALDEIIAERPDQLVMDLEQCQLMDSTFLGVLSRGAEKFHDPQSNRSVLLSNPNDRVAGLIISLGVQDLFTEQRGELDLPADVKARRLDLLHTTKLQLKETSLAAHEELMHLNAANHAKFAELTRTLREDLEKLKAGEPPALPGFDLAAQNQQAGEVGGDFYDFAPRSGLRVGVLIADVCGKGVSAAEIATHCRPILREELAAEQTPAVVLKHSLDRVVVGLPPDTFVTTLCLVLDSVARSFRMARAGHDPLLWFHAETGKTELLSPKGMALGIERTGLEEATFVEKEYSLARGDVLLLHTDGITETLAPDGTEFGCQRLAEQLQRTAALDARQIATEVFLAVKAFAHDAPQEDDRTVVVIKAL